MTTNEQPRTNNEQERGERLEALLDALEAIPPDAREEYLARNCSDPQLRHEALSLLAAESASTGYLERYTRGLLPKFRPPDLTGKRIGVYQLLKPLGRGGMGMVYEAERADGAFEQRVALKLLTTALTDSEAHQRFLAERQILAGLEHPAIARILDGGVTDDGTPWFAMERVKGLRINAYCNQHQLGIRQRLELFLHVCDAAEYAHRRLIVHRDLKPANVLVAGGRTVKLLDFGIAKLLDGDSDHAAPATRTSLRLMTPEYASPEQIRGEAVTTASDVYQLGLLLYELLTGHRPYLLKNRGAGELERVICEQPPTRLSSVIAREDSIVGEPPDRAPGQASGSTGHQERGADAITTLCRARRTSPAKLQRCLRGDLENIVHKALSKEPERRYGSADRLAQDIRRHLDGLAVTARADTWIYRGRKFLQRHAVGTAMAAVMLTVIAGMTGFYAARIQSERNMAQVERDRAEAEADKALQISQFVTSLFHGADPRETRGAELTARELLDRGVERVDRELATQPETQADMLHVLGRIYLELSLYEKAERFLRRALELRRGLGAEHPEIAKIMADFGLLNHRQGAHEQARVWLVEAAHILDSSTSGDVSAHMDVLALLGNIYTNLGEYAQSRTTLQHALALHEQATGENPESAAFIMQSIGVLLTETGELEQAENYHQQALTIYERELGADHPRVGNILMNLANARMNRGKLEDTEALYRRSLEIQQKAYGPDHATVGLTLHNLANFLITAGRHNEAIEILEQALPIYENAFGLYHPDVAYPHISLGRAHTALGHLHGARYHYQQAVMLREAVLETRQFDRLLLTGLVRLGHVMAELGDKAAAEHNMNRALAIWQHALGPDNFRSTSAFLELAAWLAEQQRCRDALPLLERIARTQDTMYNLSGKKTAEYEQLVQDCSNQQ